jgi:hypothetical protein
MDFRYRKFIFFLLLPPILFALAQARHESRQFRLPSDDARNASLERAIPVHEVGMEMAASLETLPFVIIDNTCRYDMMDLDLSGCTGLVSGESALLYRVILRCESPLFAVLRPLRPDLDVSLSLFRIGDEGQPVCVEGRDMKAEGQAERLRMESLPPGVYYIVVGGYGADCGEFELSVESLPTPPVSLREFTHTACDSGTLISWETDSEADLNHFTLYRRGVTEHDEYPIFQPRSRGDFSHGARYQFFDRAGVGEQCSYVLAAVARDGQEVEL